MFSFPVYSSGSIPDPGGWKQPRGWTGSDPVLHWSLDNLDGVVLMEGTQQKDYDALIEGKVTKLTYLATPMSFIEITSTNLAK